MAELDHDVVHESLSLLGELLAQRRERPLHLVVSGGSALLAARIVSRTTYDVDVIAMRGEVDGDIVDAHPLPAFLGDCVREVAEEEVISGEGHPRLLDLLHRLEHHDLVPRIEALAG